MDLVQPGCSTRGICRSNPRYRCLYDSAKDVQDFLEQYPAISLKLLAEMSKRLESSERQTTQVALESVITRLVLFWQKMWNLKWATLPPSPCRWKKGHCFLFRNDT